MEFFFQLIAPVAAQTPTPTPCVGGPQNLECPLPLSALEGVVGNIIFVLFGLAGFALVLMIIVGGFRILFSAGDPKAVEAGRNTLTWAFAGIALVIIAWFLLLLIQALTGVTPNITNFRIGLPKP